MPNNSASPKSTDSHKIWNAFPGTAELSVGTSIPDLPILQVTRTHIESLLSMNVVDLAALTNTIKSDLGLTICLLRTARSMCSETGSIPRISEIAVGLGVRTLRTVVQNLPVLPATHGENGTAAACTSFWMHAQLTGLIAEELAFQRANVSSEDAYMAGLLCHVGKLPALLGWRIPELEAVDPARIGGTLARVWGLPEILLEVADDRLPSTTKASRTLRQLVNAAEQWVDLLELVIDDDPVV